MKMIRKAAALLLSAVITLSLLTLPSLPVYAADNVTQQIRITRLGGADRYETAAVIAGEGWGASETVFLAGARSYADALAGTPLAYAYSAPILLTDSKKIPDPVKDEIKKLGAKKVILLGGTAAIGKDVENDLNTAGYTVERIAGETRYATALKIAEALAEKGDGIAYDVFIASGVNYPDALSASSPAALKHAPILYAPADGKLDKASADFIERSKPYNAYILGGKAAVGEAAEDEAKKAGSQSVQRLGGNDRYETSLEIAKYFDAQFKCDDIAFATGKNFPDALAGSVLAARSGIPVLLTDNSTVNDRIKSYIAQRQRSTVYVFGGINAISDSIIKDYLDNGAAYNDIDLSKGYVDLIRSVDYGDAETIVIGHKSPDSDTVGSAIAYANLLRELGINAKPAVSARINNETKYALDRFGIEMPAIVDDAAGRQFLLVDHSEYSQAINGMKNARVVGIVDHHGIGDARTAELINVRSAPIGSTCSLVYVCYKECGVDISRDMARVMLMGLLSDTSNRTSSYTEMDHAAFDELYKIAGIDDIDGFYNEMHKASMSYEGMTEREIFLSDYKEYEAGGYTFGMATFVVSGTDAMIDLTGRMLDVMESEYNSFGMDMLFAKVKNEAKDDMYMAAYGDKAVETLDGCYSGKYDGSRFFVFDKSLGRKTKLVPAITAYLEAHPKSSQESEASDTKLK